MHWFHHNGHNVSLFSTNIAKEIRIMGEGVFPLVRGVKCLFYVSWQCLAAKQSNERPVEIVLLYCRVWEIGHLRSSSSRSRARRSTDRPRRFSARVFAFFSPTCTENLSFFFFAVCDTRSQIYGAKKNASNLYISLFFAESKISYVCQLLHQKYNKYKNKILLKEEFLF